MSWYFVSTGINSKDMYGGKAYIETDVEDLHDMEKGKAHTIISEIHPDFASGQYIRNIKKLEWDLDSRQFGSEDEFLKELGSVVGSGSNDAYTKLFGRCSVKEARKKSDN